MQRAAAVVALLVHPCTLADQHLQAACPVGRDRRVVQRRLPAAVERRAVGTGDEKFVGDVLLAVEAGHVQRSVAGRVGSIHLRPEAQQLPQGAQTPVGRRRVQRGVQILVTDVDLCPMADQEGNDLCVTHVGRPVDGPPIPLVKKVACSFVLQKQLHHRGVPIAGGVVQAGPASPVGDVHVVLERNYELGARDGVVGRRNVQRSLPKLVPGIHVRLVP
uniref:Putative secreted protein n=1 Tax=Ixodes ricinus TaxID=34613 RepID=A0A6B0V2U6_IXORI